MSSEEIPQALSSQLAELAVSYQMAADKISEREKAAEQRMQAGDQFLTEQLDKINAMMADLREVMTEAGAARSRIAAKEALSANEVQIDHLKKMSSETSQTLRESCERFDRTISSTAKNISEAIGAFKIDEFQKFTEQSCLQIKDTASTAIGKMTDILRWFHWKNLALAAGLSLLVAIFMGLYINDEWPWEMHGDVVKQRNAGQAVMNAWPNLSKQDQQQLEQNIMQLSKHN